MADSLFLVKPGKKFRIKDYDPADTGPFKDKESAAEDVARHLKQLDSLQNVLYAQAKYSLLIVFQAMDAGGKDGAIEHVFSGVNPQGCSVTSFKVPSHQELVHDYLWRIHAATPGRGMIGIFNRSHYESVLVERVHNLVPRKIWEGRYEQINAFEQLLASEDTIILKFFLHISKDEQKRRLEARLADPDKNWKFSSADLKERELWDDYQAAYQDAIGRCSTEWAPWHVVPSDHKWFRNWVISATIVKALKKLDLAYPKAEAGLEKVRIK